MKQFKSNKAERIQTKHKIIYKEHWELKYIIYKNKDNAVSTKCMSPYLIFPKQHIAVFTKLAFTVSNMICWFIL